MVTRMPTSAEGTGSREIGPAVRAIGGLLLGLTLVAGIAGRSLMQPGGAGTATTQPADALPSPQATTVAVAPDLTLYVVASQEQAAILRASIAETDLHLAWLGEPLSRHAAVVVDTDGTRNVLQALRADANLHPSRWRTVEVVDLR